MVRSQIGWFASGSFVNYNGSSVVRYKIGWFASGSFVNFDGSSVGRSKFGWFEIILIGISVISGVFSDGEKVVR